MVKICWKIKGQKLQFFNRPLGAGSKSVSIPVHPHATYAHLTEEMKCIYSFVLSFIYPLSDSYSALHNI